MGKHGHGGAGQQRIQLHWTTRIEIIPDPIDPGPS
jgi:hypothetical protein